MRLIFATCAVIFVATVGATSDPSTGPSNVYLPPVSVSNYRPVVQHIARPQNVYLPPVSVHRPVVHSSPIVSYRPAVSHHHIADYRPAVQHISRPENVYLPPVNVHRPVVHSVANYRPAVSHHHVADYRPAVSHHHVADYRPAVQHVSRPENVYLPPVSVHRPAVHSVADYSPVVRPHNTYLPPAGIDLRSGFADRH